MKRLAIGALAVLGLLAIGLPASAQITTTFGDFYWSVNDNDSSQENNFNENLAGFAQFDFYLIIHVDFTDDGRPQDNVTSGLFGWEGEAVVPAELTILGRELRGPAPLNVGSQDNFIVGLGGTVPANTTPFSVLRYSAGLFVQTPPTDLVVSLMASNPSSFGAGEPLWLEGSGNQGGDLHRFTSWQDKTFTVNCTTCTVPTEEASFGSVKSKF